MGWDIRVKGRNQKARSVLAIDLDNPKYVIHLVILILFLNSRDVTQSPRSSDHQVSDSAAIAAFPGNGFFLSYLHVSLLVDD